PRRNERSRRRIRRSGLPLRTARARLASTFERAVALPELRFGHTCLLGEEPQHELAVHGVGNPRHEPQALVDSASARRRALGAMRVDRHAPLELEDRRRLRIETAPELLASEQADRVAWVLAVRDRVDSHVELLRNEKIERSLEGSLPGRVPVEHHEDARREAMELARHARREGRSEARYEGLETCLVSHDHVEIG